MFENLIVVAGLTMFLWLGSYAYYLYTSRQQQGIAKEIDILEKMLDSVSGSNDNSDDLLV